MQWCTLQPTLTEIHTDIFTHSHVNMKKILVTGGNKGIGLAIVKLLLRDFPDTFLLLGSRDVSRGEAAVKQLVTELGKERHQIFAHHMKEIFSQALLTPADCRWFTLTCAAARVSPWRWRA